MEKHHENCLTKYHSVCNCADLETVRVCSDCHSAVEEKHMGDEGWTVCFGCGNIEQATEEWTLLKFENEGNI